MSKTRRNRSLFPDAFAAVRGPSTRSEIKGNNNRRALGPTHDIVVRRVNHAPFVDEPTVLFRPNTRHNRFVTGFRLRNVSRSATSDNKSISFLARNSIGRRNYSRKIRPPEIRIQRRTNERTIQITRQHVRYRLRQHCQSHRAAALLLPENRLRYPTIGSYGVIIDRR